jgi:AraC-like DNA-binding protein
MSPGEYVTRVRLGRFVDEMRKPRANAGRLAEEIGYSSYHNLLEAFRRRTGFRPSDVGGLSDNDVRDLVHVKLALLETEHDEKTT